ncbi:Lrp/AsnC ligand binding domain-containing protein [Amycolatopsis tolypomycina]|uniref:Lrp/AsnC ligand binding domain-containing protein n=1 Tax=Amycolatopsis tolypomycina TaxID=208445 RepID=UPI0033A12522
MIDSFQRSIADLPEVLLVCVTAGNDDFLIEVTTPDIDAWHAFPADRLALRREIVGFRTSIVFRHLRKTMLEPLP